MNRIGEILQPVREDSPRLSGTERGIIKTVINPAVHSILFEIEKRLTVGVGLIYFLLRYLCAFGNEIRPVGSLARRDVVEAIDDVLRAGAEIPSLRPTGGS